MGLVVAVLLVALGLGALRGGSLRRLGQLRLRWWALVVLALAGQLAGALAGGAAYVAGLAASALLVAAFLARNARLPGMPLVVTGLLLNAVVVIANGAMPVSLYAAARAGLSTGPIADGTDPRHVLAGDGTALEPLADVIPLPWPVRPEVVSVGDALLAAGLGQIVVAGMCAGTIRRRRWGMQG